MRKTNVAETATISISSSIYQRKMLLLLSRCISEFVIGPLLYRLLEWAELIGWMSQ